VFKIHPVNPFFELQSADVYGNISGQEKRNIYKNWTLFTLKQTNMDGETFYIMFLSYTTSNRNFLVKMMNDEVNDATIESGDLIYYSSHILPFIVYFGISHKYNKLFDEQVNGLKEIEQALNANMQNHPIKIIQEMNMNKFVEGNIKVSDMGYFFTCNQEILDSPVTYAGQTEDRKVRYYFQFDNSKQMNFAQTIKTATKLKAKILTLVNEFITVTLPNNSLADLDNPQTEKLKKIKELRERLLEPINRMISEKQINWLLKSYIAKATYQTKERMNMFLYELFLIQKTNMFVNFYVFSSAKRYFPNKVEVPIQEFVDVYAKNLINLISSRKQLEIKDNSILTNLSDLFNDLAEDYKKTLNELVVDNGEKFATEFGHRLEYLLKNLNTQRFMVNSSMEIRLKNGLMSYLVAISQNPRLEKIGLFRESSSLINIYALNEVFDVYSMDRDTNGGYAVKTPVFEILTEDDSTPDDRIL
jgi:hypothetical protein